MIKRNYKWTPDLPDQRDYIFTLTKKLPQKVDLRAKCPPIVDQKELGSCTACAIAGALEYAENIDNDNVKGFTASRLFIYYQERAIEGTINYDSGAMIRDGVKACNKLGYCHETLWPYYITRFRVKPSKKAYQDAIKYKISSYHRVTDLTSFKTALASNYPVVFGFTVYESFISSVVSKTGVASMPKRNEKILGGHAVLAVGYDDVKKVAIVRNSWGINWGVRGYFTLPYAYISDRNLSDDFWVIMK